MITSKQELSTQNKQSKLFYSSFAESVKSRRINQFHTVSTTHKLYNIQQILMTWILMF